MSKRLIRNAIRCKRCGEILESKYRHDFIRCSCGQCFNDGGLDYARRGFATGTPEEAFDDLSEYAEEPDIPAHTRFSHLVDPKD